MADRTIKTDSKATRLLWGDEMSPMSWAWYKMLREHNDTKKIYEEDPYIEVYQFRDNLYGLLADNLDGKGDVWMYLIIGPKKAMLIDTSYGLGNLKALVDRITGGMELIVVNTHDHYDHAYGNCWFDKVYCHEHLVPFLENQHPHMWDYLFDVFGNCIWVQFDKNDLPEFKKYEIIGVPDGYIFDLGDGYEVELILTGGHCAGHSAFLDKTSRILFPGDNICSSTCGCGNIGVRRPGPYSEETEMSFCRDRTKLLVDRMDEFDTIFPHHFINDLDPSILPYTLETMNEIIADPTCYDYKTETWGKSRDECTMAYFKCIPNFSAIRYTYAPSTVPAKSRKKKVSDTSKKLDDEVKEKT